MSRYECLPRAWWAPAMLAALVTGCGAAEDYQWRLPADYPRPSVPADNPMSAAKVELGRYLFYDQQLSANGQQACATCHRPERAFSEPQSVATGSTGEAHTRNTPGPGQYRLQHHLDVGASRSDPDRRATLDPDVW